MDLHGFGHVAQAIADGHGPIMLLPHLGSWEWAGFWVPQVADIPITVVVEPVEPPALFEFFVSYRRQLGMNVVPLGPTVTAEALKAIKARHMLCLLCDRDLEGTGVEVEFFGERTTLPGGPAMLGLRTGAPLLPTACYFKHRGITCTIKPPIPCERTGRLRDDVARITQDIAHALEDLIRVAPEQWHLQQPNWPSDWDALAAIGKPYPKPGEQ
jgi:phosphatidylinositol dimannoside acyltransferase